MMVGPLPEADSASGPPARTPPPIAARPPDCAGLSAAPWFARLALGLVLGATDALLLRQVGSPYGQWWYVACCAAGLMLLAGWALLEVLGRARAAQVTFCVRAVVTLCNFNMWAFSHVCNLMVFIGLYFFALFGLILGAALGRLVQAGGLCRRRFGLVLAVAAIAVSWSGGLALEAAYLPGDAQLDYLIRLRRIPPGDTVEQARQRVLQQTQAWVAEHYPPGGAAGYARWSLASGEIPFEVPGRDQPLIYTRRQRGGWFLARLVCSLGLLVFGVGAGLRVRPSRHSHSMVAGGLDEMS